MPVRESVYKYAPDDIKIGPARVFIAEYDTVEPPVRISDVVSLSTYDAAAGWTSLGDTVEPIEMVMSAFDVTTVRTQQHGRVADYPGDYNNRITTTFAERSTVVKEAIMGVDLTTSVNAASENVTYYSVTKQLRPKRLAVLHLDETRVSPFALMMTVFPKAQRSGSDSSWSWDRDTQMGFPCEWNIYPDEDIVDPTSGEYIFAYDIEQP